MPHTVRDVPPPLELACLKALWSLGEASVKDVQRVVGQSRPLAYTTIMTVLERLVRKGRLARRKVGRAFLYAPQASRESMRQTAVRELLEGFFDGSVDELLRFLGTSEAKAAAATVGGGAADVIPPPSLPAPSAAPSPAPSAPQEEEGDDRIDTVLL